MTLGRAPAPEPVSPSQQPAAPSPRARRWPRLAVATQLADLEADAARGATHREWAEANKVPRSTSQNWVQRKAKIDGPAEWVTFFESPAGLAFLHRLVLTLLLVFSEMGPHGRRRVGFALERMGLAPFLAISDGSLHQLGTSLEEEIIAYEEHSRPALAAQMAPKRITVCEDETFHPQTCLVAIEPVSNFILLEKYVEKRDADTWTAELRKGLEGLPVKVIQSTSDEGAGLLGHVRKDLGAHHSPDTFHIQYDLSKATSLALAAQVRRAEEAVADAIAAKETLHENKREWIASRSSRSEVIPDFAPRFAKADKDQKSAEQALDAARARQESAHKAVRGIGDDYHPVDLSTGSLLEPAEVGKKLEKHFDEAKAVALDADLGDQRLKLIAKARKLLPALVSTLTFFWSEVAARITALGLTPDQRRAVEQYLLPLAYLDLVATKARDAAGCERLRDIASQLRAAPPALASALGLLPEQELARVYDVARECAAIFQRSSSCTEGRNGQLSLYHHGLHLLSDRKLRVLTILHNYFIQRPDGTTAAERFFGKKPPDLFKWLLEHVAMPARPRSSPVARAA